jgi:hypothetical protein
MRRGREKRKKRKSDEMWDRRERERERWNVIRNGEKWDMTCMRGASWLPCMDGKWQAAETQAPGVPCMWRAKLTTMPWCEMASCRSTSNQPSLSNYPCSIQPKRIVRARHASSYARCSATLSPRTVPNRLIPFIKRQRRWFAISRQTLKNQSTLSQESVSFLQLAVTR